MQAINQNSPQHKFRSPQDFNEQPATDPALLSNSLTDLAVRIRTAHEACGASLKASVQHAIEAGELLIEAKAQLKHGQWLPWLAERCELSERTAQLYMRTAKNRSTIEDKIRNDTADMTLTEATALLALGSDFRKLLEFAKIAETADPEEFLQLCIDHGIGVIHAPDPFEGSSEAEVLEWHVFALFLVKHCNWWPDNAMQNVEWLLRPSRHFQLEEWLGAEGDKWRRCWGMPQMPAAMVEHWNEFAAQHHDRTLLDIVAELTEIQKQYKAMPKPRKRRAKRRSRAGGTP